MATIHRDGDLALLDGKVAVVGFGSQGHAHALNLHDSGVQVQVGLRDGSSSRAAAEDAGLDTGSVADAVRGAQVVAMLVPDHVQARLYKAEIAPHLTAGKMLMFAHGFNIRFKGIVPPKNVDVTMIAPKSPGHRVREVFQEGGGVPGLIAVHQNATGNAKKLALSYGRAIGCTRAGVLETTFSEETETDLFGEQAVLCGGCAELVKAGFQTLVDAGYQPEIAYFECLHELKLIVDLMYRGGLNYMRYSVSDTAEWGDYVSGPRVVTKKTRQEMKRILRDIQSGKFARRFINENNKYGRKTMNRFRARERRQQIETVGAKLRAMMPFLNPVVISK